jgi:crotonobetainyl-CoA:carnitine CoA-transferase CaiB-like acyl-CoA transferase
VGVKPLADVRIIAIEQYGAGPYGSLHLADLGAEVIKIEDPSAGGDVSRYVPPMAEGEDSIFFEAFNRNKRSLSLDLSSPDGRAVFEDLVRNSDAVYSNLRGDVPEKIGIRYQDLKHLNPAIVCCSLSGFGMTGPRTAEPGYDYILQGLAGWMSVTGDPDGPPTKSGLSMVDYSGGFVAAISLLAGLHAARRDGIGGDADVSLFDTAVSLLAYVGAWNLNGDFTPKRMPNSAHPSLVPFQNFKAADGWIVVACAKEKFWKRLAVAIGRPELAEDERYESFSVRSDNSNELLKILDEVFITQTCEHWLSVLADAGVPVGPVYSVEQALADPHTIARGLIVETDHHRFGRVKQLASPVNFGDQPREYRRAPIRNEDFNYVMNEILEYSPERIHELGQLGAFGAVHDSRKSQEHSDAENVF